MNLLDVAALAILAVAAWSGYRSGALPQLGGLAGAAAGGFIAIFWGIPFAHDFLSELEPAVRAIIVLLGLITFVGLGEAVGSAAGSAIRAALGAGILGALDRVAGAGVGFAQGVLVIWLVGGLLAAGPVPRIAHLAAASSVVRALNTALPPPTAFAEDLNRFLDATGLPDVFVGLDPLPGPEVPTPTDREAEAIAAAAKKSTVRVSSAACRLELTGTGFVIAKGYVVTNAHVVAGARTTRVNLGGAAYDAAPVLFDPSLDVAVLYAPKLKASALRFAADDPGRGDEGATLGFPGGGPLTIVAAAVSRELEAQGRDIYDEHRVTRAVLELRAEIEPGDSGGPFVLADGTVGGLVFAQSRTDPEVGYALTPTSVATRVAPAVGRTTEADTGPCT